MSVHNTVSSTGAGDTVVINLADGLAERNVKSHSVQIVFNGGTAIGTVALNARLTGALEYLPFDPVEIITRASNSILVIPGTFDSIQFVPSGLDVTTYDVHTVSV